MTEEEEKARKDWTQYKAESSWAIFKVMSEFVEGYEKMNRIGPCVSIFGSARTPADSKYYIIGFCAVAWRLWHVG
jgi:hypothetical protein